MMFHDDCDEAAYYAEMARAEAEAHAQAQAEAEQAEYEAERAAHEESTGEREG